MDDKAKSFCKRYNAKIETSQYRISKIKNTDISFSPGGAIVDPALDIEYEQMVAIHLPQARASALVEHDEWISRAGLQDNNHFQNNVGRVANLVVEHERECRIRHENPAVRAAYEKYQNLLRLVDSHYR